MIQPDNNLVDGGALSRSSFNGDGFFDLLDQEIPFLGISINDAIDVVDFVQTQIFDPLEEWLAQGVDFVNQLPSTVQRSLDDIENQIDELIATYAEILPNYVPNISLEQLPDEVALRFAFKIGFDTFSHDLNFDLLNGNNIEFLGDASLNLTPFLEFDFSIGLDLTEINLEDGFFAALSRLGVSFDLNADDVHLEVGVGPLGAGIAGGRIGGSLGVSANFDRLTLTQLQSADLDTLGTITFDGNFGATMPLTASFGDFDFNQLGTPILNVWDDNLFDAVLPQVMVDDTDLINFSDLSLLEVLDLIDLGIEFLREVTVQVPGLDQPIPGIGRSIGSLLEVASPRNLKAGAPPSNTTARPRFSSALNSKSIAPSELNPLVPGTAPPLKSRFKLMSSRNPGKYCRSINNSGCAPALS